MATLRPPAWLILALLTVAAITALRWFVDDPIAGDLFGGKRI